MYPSISIVIPSWNQGKFIERTLLSIFKQDYPGKVEVIVSDGGSKDETVEILKKYGDKLTWWSAPDKGYVDAVTKGVAVATGDLLGIQSSDDYYLEGAFSKLVNGFNDFPEASFITGWDIQIDLDNKIQNTQEPTGVITPNSILIDNPPQDSTLVKRSVFDKVGGLRKDVDMCADMDLWYRISHFAPGHCINDFLSAYQLHPDQRTQVSTKWYDSLVRMVETCEHDPLYGSKFKLASTDKRNLYTFWKIGWTAKYDRQKANEFANEAAVNLTEFDERAKAMIYANASHDVLFPPKSILQKGMETLKNGTLLKKVSEKLLPTNKKVVSESKSYDVLQSETNLDWWKEKSN